MLVVRMRCLEVVLQELLHLAGHVCVLLAEVVVEAEIFPRILNCLKDIDV